jgi:DNA-binding Xre family transcriptional regulator
MWVRIRLPELLGEMSPYALAKKSEGRISMSTAYRLARLKGRVKTFDAGLLEAICDTLGIEDMNKLLERDKKRGRG